MIKDELLTIWQKGNESLLSDEKTDRDMITEQLNEKTLKGSRKLNFNFIFYALVQLACIVLLSMNISGYLNNPAITWILIPQLVFTVGILVFNLDTFYRLRAINNYSDSLLALIRKQLWFYRRPYEIWQVLAAFSAIMLITNLNMYVDNNNGDYVINNRGMYAGITIAAFLFIYGAQKISSMLGLRNLKAYLADLQAGNLEESGRMERSRRKSLWLWIGIFLLLTAFLVFGIMAASVMR